MTRRQFGSICAEFTRGAQRGQVLAGDVVLHHVASSAECGRLIGFWGNQHRAQAQGAILEALTWLRVRFEAVES